MSIQLTPQQQQALDKEADPPRIIDPRTNTTYILIPEMDDEAVRELLEDERRQQAIHAIALRNAAGRVNQKAVEEKLVRLNRSRLARECAKLNPAFEKALAEEDLSEGTTE